MALSDAQWLHLVEQRATQPDAAVAAMRGRARRPLLTDGRLFIIAADHTARGALGVGDDPFVMAERAQAMGVELVDLPDLYRQADFITIHTPRTPETENLISAASIAQMKDGVRIVNCARGGIVNEADLHAALVSGKVAGWPWDTARSWAPLPRRTSRPSPAGSPRRGWGSSRCRPPTST